MLFTAEHEDARRALQKFIAAEINPFVDEWEKAEIFPAHELFKKLGDLGFLGLNKPVEFGGQGLDYSYALMMAEELGAIRCGGVPMAIGVQTDMATPALARFGSDEVRREFLAPAIAGDAVACIGVSEPGAGSDVASIKTHARSDGDDYVINGGKMWITNGVQADWMMIVKWTLYAMINAEELGITSGNIDEALKSKKPDVMRNRRRLRRRPWPDQGLGGAHHPARRRLRRDLRAQCRLRVEARLPRGLNQLWSAGGDSRRAADQVSLSARPVSSPHHNSSSPANAGDPVRRGLSA
jgi:hypothetical protein